MVSTFNQNDQNGWDDIFQKTPTNWKAQEPIAPQIDCLEYFKKNNVKKFMDLGCGVGLWSVFLSKSGMTARGIDFSQAGIAYASKWSEEEKLDAQFKVAPITQNPFEDETFDAVVASLIFDNVSKIEFAIALNSLNQCLKPGGVMYALFNPFMTPQQLQNAKKSDNPTRDFTFVSYSDDDLRQLFPNFTIEKFYVYPELTVRALFLRKVN